MENTVLTMQFCCNYGGRAEILDATAAIARDLAAGKVQRLSNCLLWQSAYTELVFLDTLWPDFNGRQPRHRDTDQSA